MKVFSNWNDKKFRSNSLQLLRILAMTPLKSIEKSLLLWCGQLWSYQNNNYYLRWMKEVMFSLPETWSRPLLEYKKLIYHVFHETSHSVTSYFTKKKTPNDAVTPQRHCQFAPKMKANAVPRFLSSLVWIDSGVVVSQHRLVSFFMK